MCYYKHNKLFLFKKNFFFFFFGFGLGESVRQNNFLLELMIISLVKWLSVRLRTKWFWVRVQLQSLHLQISRLLRARSSLTFRQL